MNEYGKKTSTNITNTFKAFCNNVGVEYKPSHTCRRSYVTNCLDKGMKLASTLAVNKRKPLKPRLWQS
ncbi:hypothetical protein [Bacteroides congonensis]|uniref:hypothetical protein n=1 Tax=Bacteroides congonensis TaxID=1871006 RepID=UPI0032193F3D